MNVTPTKLPESIQLPKDPQPTLGTVATPPNPPAAPTVKGKSPFPWRIVKWAVGALVIIGLLYLLYVRTTTSNADLVTYRVAPVVKQDVALSVSATGTIQPWTTVDIKSKAGGLVEAMLVTLGDRVKKNQVIARIDPTDSQLVYSQSVADQDSARAKQNQSQQLYKLQITQTPLSIAQAKAQLDSTSASMRAAVAALKSASDTSAAQPAVTTAAIRQAQASYDSTKQDLALLVASQPADLAAAQSAYDQSVQTTNNALAIERRTYSLYQQGFVAAQDYDTAKTTLTLDQAAQASAKVKLDMQSASQSAARLSQAGKVRTALAQLQNAQAQGVDVALKIDAVQQAQAALNQARALVVQSTETYRLALAGQLNDRVKQLDIASAEAATARTIATVTNAKTTLDQTIVRAPSDGVVLLKYVDQGAMITSGISLNSSGTAIVQLGDVSRKYVDVQVDETDIANIRVGQSVGVAVDAFPGEEISGHVILVNPGAQVDQNVTTIHVRVEIDPKTPSFSQLKPYMNATCIFQVEDHSNVIAVATDAVHDDGNKSYVQLAQGGKPVATKLKSTAGTKDLTGVKLERRDVTVGLRGNSTVEITSGLNVGDLVVVQTIQPVKPAATGAASPSPMGGGGGGGMGRGGGR